MNTNNGEGNTQIPQIEDLVIEEDWDTETIKEKTAEHNQKIREAFTKFDEDNKQLYARTKKAEGFEFKDGKWVKPGNNEKTETKAPQTDSSLSTKDVFVLIKAGVPEEDIDEVVEYSKLKNISISEALNSPIVKTILANNQELRDTANGTHTGAGKKGSAKLSDEALLENARNGILPESDDDMRRLTILQRAK